MAIESWNIWNILWELPTYDEGQITLCSRFWNSISSFAASPITSPRPCYTSTFNVALFIPTQCNRTCFVVAQASKMNSWNNFLARSIVEY
jgi:hypothetical protein